MSLKNHPLASDDIAHAMDDLSGIEVRDRACGDFAPDTLNPVASDRDICTTCFYRKQDHDDVTYLYYREADGCTYWKDHRGWVCAPTLLAGGPCWNSVCCIEDLYLDDDERVALNVFLAGCKEGS